MHGPCPCPNDLAAREGLKCPCQHQTPLLHLPSHSSLTVPQPEKEQEKCHGEGKRKHRKTMEGSCLEGTTPVPAWNFQQGSDNQSLFHIRDVNTRHMCKGPDHRFARLRDLLLPRSRDSGTKNVRPNLPLLQCTQLRLLPPRSQCCGQVPVQSILAGHVRIGIVPQQRTLSLAQNAGTGMGADT